MNRTAEALLWGIVAPVPALIVAFAAGGYVCTATNAAPPGLAVGIAALAGMGAIAKRRHGVCLAAFACGVILAGIGLFEVLMYSMAHTHWG